MAGMALQETRVIPQTSTEAAALSVTGLQVSYLGNVVLRDVSFSIPRRKAVGIIGPNGAGKSTLLKAILGLIPKDKGRVTILGRPLKAVRKQIAYIPQRSDIDWAFPINVLETVLLGTYPALGLVRRPGRQQRDLALHCLERVGMADYARRQIGQLSGGQQQRVFIARALAQQAEIFFLDEPFVGIDMASEETIIELLNDLRRQGKTLLIVHHNLNKVRRGCDEALLLNKELVAAGPVDQVLRQETLFKTFSGQYFLFDHLGA